MAHLQPQERRQIRLHMVEWFSSPLADAFLNGDLDETLEDLEKIERYIIGETE